jgi:hypothetical protein
MGIGSFTYAGVLQGGKKEAFMGGVASEYMRASITMRKPAYTTTTIATTIRPPGGILLLIRLGWREG